MTVTTIGAEIARLISCAPLQFNTETELQEKLADLFAVNGLDFVREFRMNAHDRIDFMLTDGTGIEAKIDGSFADVLRQLHRYTKLDTVRQIVLVTTEARHLDMPSEINGKSIFLSFISFARGL